jgi:uncharacterized protein YidB (DUF937 family)
VTQTDILGKLGGGQGQQGGIAAISQLFGGNGLQGMMGALQAKGMTNEVQSWVRNGKNLPISGSDIKRAVDPQQLAAMAKQQGMTPEELCEHIAQVLPDLVDKATPNGQVPKQAGVDSLMGMLNKNKK